MKVGIVSLYGYFNYGNRLQSYAAQQVLRHMGHDTEVIYIQSNRKRVRELLKSIYFSKSAQLFIRSSLAKKNKFRRQKNFEKFNKQFISAKGYSSVDKISDADFFVLGSDQVWNPKRYDSVKKELFFLTFTESGKKICLAPSFGVSTLPDEWKSYFAEQLSTFPLLSVREAAGQQIIKELTGRDAEVLIDPTMMLDAAEWATIAQRPEGVDLKEKYVLNYFIGDLPLKAADKNDHFSNEYNYKVCDLLDPVSTGLYTSGPSEFLYLIQNADLIQTDSFHACVFSFLFGKPFLLYPREGKDPDMLSRLEALFSTFNLERKNVDSGLPNDDFECDYSEGYARLEEERTKVLCFLKKSMGIEE